MRSLIALFCVAIIVNAQQNPGCLQGWSYFAKSNKCYKVFGGEFDSIRPTTWGKAEEYCTTFNGGHLASFHSDDEVTFVVDVSQRALWDDGGASPLQVGLSYVGNNKWEWTDGSRFNYIRWIDISGIANDNYDKQNPHAHLGTTNTWVGVFDIWNAEGTWAFVCQMPPSSEV